jgi:hypothetical protein
MAAPRLGSIRHLVSLFLLSHITYSSPRRITSVSRKPLISIRIHMERHYSDPEIRPTDIEIRNANTRCIKIIAGL